MLTLGELCDLVAGRVALVIELKSRFDGDMRLPPAPPRCWQAMPARSRRCRSIPARSRRCASSRPALAARHRRACGATPATPVAGANVARSRYLLHALAARPHFLAYRVKDLPRAAAAGRAHVLRPAAADLDGAQPGGPRRAATLCRPDDFRGISAINRRLGPLRMPPSRCPSTDLRLRVVPAIAEIAGRRLGRLRQSERGRRLFNQNLMTAKSTAM